MNPITIVVALAVVASVSAMPQGGLLTGLDPLFNIRGRGIFDGISNDNSATINDANALVRQIDNQNLRNTAAANQAAADQAAAIRQLAALREADAARNSAAILQRAANTAARRRANSDAQTASQVAIINAGAARDAIINQAAADAQIATITANSNAATINQVNDINAQAGLAPRDPAVLGLTAADFVNRIRSFAPFQFGGRFGDLSAAQIADLIAARGDNFPLGFGGLFGGRGFNNFAGLPFWGLGGLRGDLTSAQLAAAYDALGGLNALTQAQVAAAGNSTLAQVSTANTARNNEAARTAGAISASNTATFRNANAITNANIAAANDAEAISEQIRLQSLQSRTAADQAAQDQARAINDLAAVRRAAFDANRAIISQRARNTAVNRRVNSAGQLVSQVSRIRAGAFRDSAIIQAADDTQAARIAENANNAIVSQTAAINAGIPAATINQTGINDAILANAALRLRLRTLATL